MSRYSPALEPSAGGGCHRRNFRRGPPFPTLRDSRLYYNKIRFIYLRNNSVNATSTLLPCVFRRFKQPETCLHNSQRFIVSAIVVPLPIDFPPDTYFATEPVYLESFE